MALNLELPDAGRMQHQVVIQDREGGKDTRGQAKQAWRSRPAISAWVQPLRGDEIIRAQSIFARATHRVHVYAGQGISSENRLVYDQRTFEIGYVENVNEAGGRQWLLCVEESK